MRRSSAPLVLGLVALLAAGCGGNGTGTTSAVTTSPATTAAAPDPGRDTIEAFVSAARAGNAAAMWRLLSTGSRERLGPTLADFRTGSAAELTEGLGSYRTFQVIVSERITPELGVVAIDGTRVAEGVRERQVYASVLRIEGSAWKVELEGPVSVRAIGPDPGARESVVAQVAAAIEGPAGSGTAVMYVDGQTVNPTVSGTTANATVYANLEPSLERGRHTVVVLASAGRQASALGWAFTVTKGP